MTTEIHNTHTCTCEMCGWARKMAANKPKSPLETYYGHLRLDRGDTGFLVPEAKNVPQGDSGAGNGIPVTKTAFGFHLEICGVCTSVAEQFRDLELFDHQLCPEGRQLFRNPSQPVVTAPTFTEEWDSAPRAMIRYVERSMAEYWFLRGVRAGEAGAMIAINGDLKELRRVAAERIEQR